MVSLAPVSLPLLQSATCFMHEFWPDLEHIPLAPDDPQLQAEFSKILPASCALLLQGSRICYIRVDEVGGWVGGHQPCYTCTSCKVLLPAATSWQCTNLLRARHCQLVVPTAPPPSHPPACLPARARRLPPVQGKAMYSHALCRRCPRLPRLMTCWC